MKKAGAAPPVIPELSLFQWPAAGFSYTRVNLMELGRARVSYSCSKNGLAGWNGVKLHAE